MNVFVPAIMVPRPSTRNPGENCSIGAFNLLVELRVVHSGQIYKPKSKRMSVNILVGNFRTTIDQPHCRDAVNNHPFFDKYYFNVSTGDLRDGRLFWYICILIMNDPCASEEVNIKISSSQQCHLIQILRL